MKSYYLDEKLNISDQSIKSDWLERTFNINVDAIVCLHTSSLPTMSQVEDTPILMKFKNKFMLNATPPEESDRKLFFIIQYKQSSIIESVYLLYILIRVICDILGKDFFRDASTLYFFNQTISKSTVLSSATHQLVVFELNLAPILKHQESFKGRPAFIHKEFGLEVMAHYIQEIHSIEKVLNKEELFKHD